MKDLNKPLPGDAIAKCQLPHCYNGHMLMTLGLIPHATDVRYGDIRDRERTDGAHWLQPELKGFFNTQLCEANREYSALGKKYSYFCTRVKNKLFKR